MLMWTYGVDQSINHSRGTTIVLHSESKGGIRKIMNVEQI